MRKFLRSEESDPRAVNITNVSNISNVNCSWISFKSTAKKGANEFETCLRKLENKVEVLYSVY